MGSSGDEPEFGKIFLNEMGSSEGTQAVTFQLSCSPQQDLARESRFLGSFLLAVFDFSICSIKNLNCFPRILIGWVTNNSLGEFFKTPYIFVFWQK